MIIIKNMETSLKTGFAPIFSCCPKNLSCPNFGGAAAPLAPPARTPMNDLMMIVPFHSPFGQAYPSVPCKYLNPSNACSMVLLLGFLWLFHYLNNIDEPNKVATGRPKKLQWCWIILFARSFNYYYLVFKHWRIYLSMFHGLQDF